MSIDSGQHIHQNASAFRVLFRRECRDAYEISNCSDLEKSRSRQSERLRSPGLGAEPQQAETHSFRRSEMDGFFGICNTNALLATIVPN